MDRSNGRFINSSWIMRDIARSLSDVHWENTPYLWFCQKQRRCEIRLLSEMKWRQCCFLKWVCTQPANSSESAAFDFEIDVDRRSFNERVVSLAFPLIAYPFEYCLNDNPRMITRTHHDTTCERKKKLFRKRGSERKSVDGEKFCFAFNSRSVK